MRGASRGDPKGGAAGPSWRRFATGVRPGAREGKPGPGGAAPARGFAPRTREALGARPLRLRGAAFNGWTRLRRRRAKACRMKGATRLPSQPGSTGPGTEIAASGAPDGERADRKARNRRKGGLSNESAVRRSIPSHSRGASHATRGKETRACPGPTKEYGRCCMSA
jgi:hypothetical protein